MGRIQPKLLQQRVLILLLPRQIRFRIFRRDQTVFRRIPQLIVDAVEYSNQYVTSFPENAFQTVAEVAIFLNFSRIGGADGRDEISLSVADLHEIDHPVELE